MLAGLGVTEFFGESKVDAVDQVGLFAKTNQEVVWLDITVNEVLGVNVLNTTDLSFVW